MDPSHSVTTLQPADLKTLVFCLMCALALVLARYLIYRVKRLCELPEEPPREPGEKPEAEPRQERPPPMLQSGWDDRDYDESWDRERRRRYGRHQHKHGRHHYRTN